MKKTFAIILTLVFCFFAVSCSNNSSVNNVTSVNCTTEKIDNYMVLSNQVSEKSELQTDVSGDLGGADLLPRKYRNNYYQIPTFFSEIVDSDMFLKWEKEYYLNNYPDNTNIMVMVDFIKEFNISKEDFERANLEYAHFIDETYSHICLDPQDYADQEMQEIFNTEIIYTFDNDIINEYYLGIDYPFLNEYKYVEALEAGTYETRTTQFIDIEQMEADIIAKYGEAEIVTEAASIPEETTITE